MKLDPRYVAGLVDGEGCFCIVISKHKTNKIGFDARLVFEVEMIIEDKPLLLRLQETLGCGQIYILKYERYGWRPHVKYAVKSYKDIKRKIIPFFKHHALQSKKKKDFDYFCKASEIFEKREHLSLKGLNELREIQSKMNLRRKLKLSSARVRENRVPSGEKSIAE
ncbi:MAG TPA: LAGLIDADG family homing endonuclease [Candidatus Saccharimonadales bacterium]|nr:LAGLIDADG family homing endonuclease [Candidatus Saccharimonadales bacterium]HSX48674.1 LAGLIDADG family homing endonuclease [Candidatus Saccharimonadales bacterium]